MKCLILGGAGFLGSHLCDGLLAAGHAVRIFDRINVSRANLAHALDRIEWIEGDFSDHSLYGGLVEDVDIVFHLISTTVPKTSNENPAYDVDSNLVASVEFLEAARKSRVRKIVFFSSGGTVYGIPSQIPIAEDHTTEPICSYGIHKLAIEKYLHLYHHLYGLDYTILRISNPYGERQRSTGIQGVVAAFIDRALCRLPLEIWGDGSVIRDYIYVGDVVDAVLSAVRYTGETRIFNVGSGIGLSLRDLSDRIQTVVGQDLEVQYKPAGKLHVPANVLDISRAKCELHWQPATSLQAGIQRTIRFMHPEQ